MFFEFPHKQAFEIREERNRLALVSRGQRGRILLPK